MNVRVSPLISVVITCYDQARFVGEAVESVLRQTLRDFEIIVIDDGSKDDPKSVVSAFPSVEYVRQENQGVSGARNAGLRRSRGTFVVFLDADDRLLPHALATGSRALSEHPACAYAYGHVDLVDTHGAPLPAPDRIRVERDFYRTLLERNDIWTPGQVMYRRSTLEAVGGFRREAGDSADLDLHLRITRTLPIYCHDEVVLEYRLHETNTSHKSALMLKSSVDVYRSEWEHVKGRRDYEDAYAAGLRTVREFYGRGVVRDIRAHVRAGEVRRAIDDAMILVRCDPAGAARFLARGALKRVRRFGREARRSAST